MDSEVALPERWSLDGRDSLLRQVPAIRRARDFHLYTQDGRRMLDLWQYDGRAILGHTPPGMLRELKNTASRGLFTPLPGPWEGRFCKALAAIFPHRAFRLYAGETALRRALAVAGYESAAPFPDPAMGFPASPGQKLPENTAVLWRPFLEEAPAQALAVPEPLQAILVPMLPIPPELHVVVLEPSLEGRFPSSDLFPPVLLAVAVRGLADLIASMPERGCIPFPRLHKALSQSSWQRRGIYLHGPRLREGGGYVDLWRHFLGEGVLLPPHLHGPLIIPGTLSPGEEAQLGALLRFFG